MTSFTNSLDPFTKLMELRRNQRSGELELVPSNGMQELADVLNSLGAGINANGVQQDELSQAVLDLIGVRPQSGFATLNGFPTQNGGSTYAPLCFGPWSARYVATTLTSEAWVEGAEVPTNELRHANYVALQGDTPSSGAIEFGPTVAIRLPVDFTRFEGLAIAFKYTIEDVSGYATNDTIEVGLTVEATIPGFAAVTKNRVETLTAPGPYGDGGVYSTLAVTRDDLGDGWVEGALLKIKPYFKITGASSGITLDLRWSDLRVNMR